MIFGQIKSKFLYFRILLYYLSANNLRSACIEMAWQPTDYNQLILFVPEKINT
jgi:hypothetical protein